MKLFTAIILLLVVTVCEAAPVQIQGARIREMPDGTQLIFELSGSARHSSFTLDNPPRLVVDLNDARLHPSQRDMNLRSADVESVRLGIRAGVDLRIVLDLASAFKCKTYVLSSPKGHGHRLVVDVFRHAASAARLTQSKLSSPAASWGQRDIVIAIDPGHGGKDSGAIGPNGTQEKDVVLQIAKRLQSVVNAEPGMRAILTRKDDTYLRLRERMEIARGHHADMFVSIHADAAANPRAKGSSVFMLSPKGASSTAARWLADKENASDLMGGVSLGDKDEEVASVLLDLSQEATLEASMYLAEKVLGNLRKVGNVHKRHVERAGFVVLKSPDIPSILVETAFITNPTEEPKLSDGRHQQVLTQAIMNGIRDYFRQRLPQHLMLAAAPAAAIDEPIARAVPPRPVQSRPVAAPESAPPKLAAAPVAKPIPELRPVSAAAAQPVPELKLVSRPYAQPVPELKLISTASEPLVPELRLVSRASPLRVPQRVIMSAAAPPPIPAQRHVIRRGESLLEIAVRYNVTLSRLRAVNGLSRNQLRMPAGTSLTIPTGDG